MSLNTRDRNAGLLVLLGSAVFLLGLGVLVWTGLIGSISVYFCGWIIAASGSIVAGGALFSRQRDLFWLNLFRGCLYGVLGFMIVSKPRSAQDALGLLVSSVLLVEGIFEIAPGALLGFRRRIGRTAIGIYAVVMGAVIWAYWPGSGHRFIELCLAIDMLLNGYALVTVGVAGPASDHLDWYSLLGRVETAAAPEATPSEGSAIHRTGPHGGPRHEANRNATRAA